MVSARTPRRRCSGSESALTRSAITGTALVPTVARAPDLQTFTTTLGGMVEVTIRGFMKDGEPWFVAKDATKALGYSNGPDAVAKHVDDDQKGSVAFRDGTSTKGGNPNKTIISEGGLYALIMGSKLPQAREFRRWVLDTVLPSIRKNGGYHHENESIPTL